MSKSILALFAAALFAAPALAATHTETVQFAPGRTLRFSLKSGDVRITKGADLGHIIIRYTPDPKRPAEQDKVRFVSKTKGPEVEIAIKSPAHLAVDTEIELPSPASLIVHLRGGDLRVEGVEGDKDLRLFAGDIRLDLGAEPNLRKAVASSHVGDINAPGLGTIHGWLGHTWKYEGGGRYSLYAHTNVGDVHLFTN